MSVKLIISDGKEVAALPERNEDLVRAVARTHHWKEQLINGEVDSIRAIARQTGHDERYTARSLRLAFLAPDIVERVLAGTAAPDMALAPLLERIPLGWRDQQKLASGS